MNKNKHPLLIGTLLLTLAGLTSRIIGFFYKIFLASLIGAEGIGLYQMVFPLYVLCTSFASTGIQTAISRFTAEKLSLEQPKEAEQIFHTGLFLALAVSILLSAALSLTALPIARFLLQEERCSSLIRLMALAIPFETLHTCTNGYFLGRKKAAFPAVSQLLEQCIRTGATLILWQIFLQNGQAPSATLAALGLLASEITAALVSLSALLFQKETSFFVSFKSLKTNLPVILSMSLPITANRLMLNLLQSAEAILLPLLLQHYYRDRSTALSIYGIFSGMVLPLILFPCTITNSFSMVLLPSISESHVRKDDKKIAAAIHSSLLLCLFLGITCTSAFLLFGPSVGLLLYQTPQAGDYLSVLAWICPFLYLTATNSSILHGLGKTMAVFRSNLIGLLIRLLFFLLFIPHFGIRGCLWGFLIGHLLTAFSNLHALKHSVRFSFSVNIMILFPCGCCISAAGLLKLLQFLFPVLHQTQDWLPFLLSAGIWSCTVLFLYRLFLPKGAGSPAHGHSH